MGAIKIDALTVHGITFAELNRLALRQVTLDLDGVTDTSPIEGVLGQLFVDYPPVSFSGQLALGSDQPPTYLTGFIA